MSSPSKATQIALLDRIDCLLRGQGFPVDTDEGQALVGALLRRGFDGHLIIIEDNTHKISAVKGGDIKKFRRI
tara:strand:+ start:23 stop:241 length:219 start_codon:yes stop_codon:yes gene_type:complete